MPNKALHSDVLAFGSAAGEGRRWARGMPLVYRGVNAKHHKRLKGVLKPKESVPFIKGAKWDEAEWDNAYWDKNYKNAVVTHQLHQAGLPTSGISTTPSIFRAIFYATHAGRYSDGYIYSIDLAKCCEHSVSIYYVTELVSHPSIPEDDEVILVAQDFGALPVEVIVDVRYFKNGLEVV